MQILSYSPSVEVYAAVKTKDGFEYLDLSRDVVQCTVTRKVDGESTFSVRLQNKGKKYNGRFLPMDRVSIRCTKLESHQLIVGYITSTPAYTAYIGDVTIQGSCPIYRLKNLYWDPMLYESQALVGKGGAKDSWDSVLLDLLKEVGGYGDDQVFIGKMPDEAIKFAHELYEDSRESGNQLRTMVDDFYEVLQTHGNKFSTSAAATSSTASSGGLSNATQTSNGGNTLLGDTIDYSCSKQAFISKWGPRIDKYIRSKASNSPVAGHGNVYAEAAWIGKMDPRWLPAIAWHETSLGTCGSHAGSEYNLYGWGCTDSGDTSVASGASGYDKFIHFILDNAGNRNNGWGGAKVLNEYRNLEELDATYCSSSASRVGSLRSDMQSI